MRPPSQFPEEIASEADTEPDSTRLEPMAICPLLAGRAVIRVVDRCNDARETNKLGEWKNGLERIE